MKRSASEKRIKKMNTAERWDWLQHHPEFILPLHDVPDFWQALPMALDVDFVLVNPKTNRVSKDERKNTRSDCWLEFGPIEFYEAGDTEPRATHDIELDCGGRTFEKAFRKLCLRVLKHYGDYERET